MRFPLTFGGEQYEQKRRRILRQSIIDMRRVHSKMDEDKFAAWYHRKFGVTPETIHRVLVNR